jgi:hypothetical protein
MLLLAQKPLDTTGNKLKRLAPELNLQNLLQAARILNLQDLIVSMYHL